MSATTTAVATAASSGSSSSVRWTTTITVLPFLFGWLFLLFGSSILLLVSSVDAAAAAASSSARNDDARRSLRRQQQRRRRTTATTMKQTQQQQQQQEPQQQRQRIIKDYELLDASVIPELLREWEGAYPDLIRVTTSQKKYGLPTAGKNRDCPFWEESRGCPNHVFTLQDYASHPEGSTTSSNLPEVFWSGCLHGNERTGPTAVLEAAALLLEAARCESLPRRRRRRWRSSSTEDDGDDNNNDNVVNDTNIIIISDDLNFDFDFEEVREARECRKSLREKGIDDIQRKWLARLMTTRRIVVVPTANALGYYRNVREENNIDPNRDFPYENNGDDGTTDTSDNNPKDKFCMKSIAARTINEVFRDHMFQLSLTFHAGTEMVGYEWGSFSWFRHLSPDHEAQKEIGGAYSRYGGGWNDTEPYKHGTINDVLYPVRGGMEDWAYAGSWTPDKVVPCTPRKNGDVVYPPEKTVYNNSTLRAFNMLVEASDAKDPQSDLGNSVDVLNRDSVGNGHVSRNIRLALLSADIVEPYVSVVGVNDLTLTDDAVPMMTKKDSSGSCGETSAAVAVTKNGGGGNGGSGVEIKWTVGGAFTIDSTRLWYAPWNDVTEEEEEEVGCWTQPASTDNFRTAGSVMNGTGFFSERGSYPSPDNEDEGVVGGSGIQKKSITNGPLFSASIPLEAFEEGDKIVVVASATVDQSWKEQPSPNDVLPRVPPQSHIVHARTDPDYHHESNGKHIRGRTMWFSAPLTLVVVGGGEQLFGDDDNSANGGTTAAAAVELNPRLGECKNHPKKFVWKVKKRNSRSKRKIKKRCTWVRKKLKQQNNENFCEKTTSEGVPLYALCPVTCGLCVD